MAKPTTIPDLREFEASDDPGFPAKVRSPHYPRALIRDTAQALCGLKERFFGLEDYQVDGLHDAVYFQAYLERGKKLMAMHHLEALQGRLDRSKLKRLCSELQTMVSLCEKNIDAENRAVRTLNEEYAAALAARKKELEGAQ